MKNFGIEQMLGTLILKCVEEHFFGSVIPFVKYLEKYTPTTLFTSHKEKETQEKHLVAIHTKRTKFHTS